jgi:hypothetical protein
MDHNLAYFAGSDDVYGDVREVYINLSFSMRRVEPRLIERPLLEL